MKNSIAETMRKINATISRQAFLAIISTLLILLIFFGLRIYTGYNSSNIYPIYTKSNYIYKDSSKFIYASSRGSKYYYYNCESKIDENNKIYFSSEADAEKFGYTLSKSC